MLAAADEVFRLDTPRAFALYDAALELGPEGEELERALYGSGIAGRRTGSWTPARCSPGTNAPSRAVVPATTRWPSARC